jgi:hypothetical protein
MVAMEERQDIYSGRPLAWRWVGVGILVVLGTASLTAAVLAALRVDVGSLPALVLVTSVAFGVGGAVVGLLSPGYTAWEAGIASVVAASAALFLATRLLIGGYGLLVLLPLVIGWGLLCGLAGGWLGERLQRRG